MTSSQLLARLLAFSDSEHSTQDREECSVSELKDFPASENRFLVTSQSEPAKGDVIGCFVEILGFFKVPADSHSDSRVDLFVVGFAPRAN